MLGQTINNYIIERKLGDGGMGDVFLARHNRVNRVVAIKVLHQNLFSNESIRQRFKNEANALIELGHPNIVKIFDYVEQDNLACLIMEYLDGYTLDDYIAKVSGPIPSSKAIGIMCEVLDAVQYAHDNKIYHRDIKPGNIMLSADGTSVRVMDFGIAKFAGKESLHTTHVQAQLGTPFYMSPEQVKGLPYSVSSDIYSLGVTLFEMVTGICPYHTITNLFELHSKIVNESLPPTSAYYPNVSDVLQQAIQKATQKNPGERFASCKEFKEFLLRKEKEKPVLPLAIVPENSGNKKAVYTTSKMPVANSQHHYQTDSKKAKHWWAYGVALLGIIGIVAFVSQRGEKSQIVAEPAAASATKPVSLISPAGGIDSVGKTESKPSDEGNQSKMSYPIKSVVIEDAKRDFKKKAIKYSSVEVGEAQTMNNGRISFAVTYWKQNGQRVNGGGYYKKIGEGYIFDGTDLRAGETDPSPPVTEKIIKPTSPKIADVEQYVSGQIRGITNVHASMATAEGSSLVYNVSYTSADGDEGSAVVKYVLSGKEYKPSKPRVEQ